MPCVTSTERRAIEQGLEKGVFFGQFHLMQRIHGIAQSSLEDPVTQLPVSLRAELDGLPKQLSSR